MKKDITDEILKNLRQSLAEQEEKEVEKDDEKEDDTETSSKNSDFTEMVSRLLHSQTQVHIFHLGTKGNGSYAAHKALQGYYEGIDSLVDGIIESYQGKHGLVTGYDTYDISKFESVSQCISYLEDLGEMIEEKRDSVKESYLQNQIDTIQELLYSTLYKLKFLK
jgi:DNA-binding ferritin-like protein